MRNLTINLTQQLLSSVKAISENHIRRIRRAPHRDALAAVCEVEPVGDLARFIEAAAFGRRTEGEVEAGDGAAQVGIALPDELDQAERFLEGKDRFIVAGPASCAGEFSEERDLPRVVEGGGAEGKVGEATIAVRGGLSLPSHLGEPADRIAEEDARVVVVSASGAAQLATEQNLPRVIKRDRAEDV